MKPRDLVDWIYCIGFYGMLVVLAIAIVAEVN